MTRRRFIADSWTATTATLTGDQAAHLARVLRATPGQIYDIVSNGFLHRAEITRVTEQQVDFTLHEELESGAALPLHLPLFLKDFTATLTTAEGDEITTSAIEKLDLENVYTSFPGLRPLASEPLLRETMISPGQSAEGMILLHFPVTKEVWDHRRDAMLNVDLYHQGQQSVIIGRASEVIPAKADIAPAAPASSPTN